MAGDAEFLGPAERGGERHLLEIAVNVRKIEEQVGEVIFEQAAGGTDVLDDCRVFVFGGFEVRKKETGVGEDGFALEPSGQEQLF